MNGFQGDIKIKNTACAYSSWDSSVICTKTKDDCRASGSSK